MKLYIEIRDTYNDKTVLGKVKKVTEKFIVVDIEGYEECFERNTKECLSDVYLKIGE